MKIVNVMAASLDAHIAGSEEESDEQRRSYGFTNEVDRKFVRQQIQTCDAIITGASSMRASGSAWPEMGKSGRPPHWYVYSRSGLKEGLAFWAQSDFPRTIVSPNAFSSFYDRRVENLVYGETSAATAVYKDLIQKGYQKVLLFGGGYINKLFYEEGLVDELLLTVCPLFVGNPAAPQLVTGQLSNKVFFRLNGCQIDGDFAFLSYTVKNRAK